MPLPVTAQNAATAYILCTGPLAAPGAQHPSSPQPTRGLHEPSVIGPLGSGARGTYHPLPSVESSFRAAAISSSSSSDSGGLTPSSRSATPYSTLDVRFRFAIRLTPSLKCPRAEPRHPLYSWFVLRFPEEGGAGPGCWFLLRFSEG